MVSVFDELEPRPLFFPPSPDPSVAGGAADGAGSGAAAAARYESLPPLDSGGLRRKTDKLAGMIRVVAAMLLTTALLYSTVGESIGGGWLAGAVQRVAAWVAGFGARACLLCTHTAPLPVQAWPATWRSQIRRPQTSWSISVQRTRWCRRAGLGLLLGGWCMPAVHAGMLAAGHRLASASASALG